MSSLDTSTPDGGSVHLAKEDSVFSAQDDHHRIFSTWRDMMQKGISYGPRTTQRYFLVYLAILLVVWLAWRLHFGPKYAQYTQEIRDMDALVDTRYGTNARPKSKDLIHLQKMDPKHLPVGDKRLIFVGDVHGCLEELQALLKKVDFDQSRDHLILTGDIIAKGPDSSGVVSLAQKLGASCVRGNHEDKLLRTFRNMEAKQASIPEVDEERSRASDFLGEKSGSTGDSKRQKLAKQLSKSQLAWLNSRPVILEIGQLPRIGQTAVVHAGLVPGVPLEHQDPYQCMNMRTIDLKTGVPSEKHEGFAWERLWNHKQKKLPKSRRVTVIYGHDARRGKNIQKYSKGLDSGCVRGGQLTGLIIDAKGKETYVQVQCKKYVS
ncbi:ser/Thr protein phosphatase-like protein family [Westerdykella ornata]|uniref:Ser/Thr protein phosphatase-like protein family n=1 Tax=Westerdykella ornata TaxID=318751 RepID=A0A6A6JMH7_WESOR|nr:ser/Thr protein phosphatase-like protein family [Westerdykella ornata]KAF2277717.1 ser/Thr protein phosphatase-like protein family [Westerdykella ornata]